MKIEGTSPGSPAAKAGFLPGDVIVEMDGRKITNIYDLTDALNDGTPGKEITIRVMRGGQPVILHATLGERQRRE